MAAERPEQAKFPYFSSSPSFGRAPVEYDKKSCDGPDSPTFGGAHRVEPPLPPVKSASHGNEDDYDASSDDFEFSIELKSAAGFSSVDADEIFSGGRMLPVYPVFNRDLIRRGPAESKESEKADPIPIQELLIEEKEAASEEPSPPPPVRCKKSASTGALRSLLRNLTIGRSHSDGKEKFVFIEASRPESPSASSSGPAKKKAPNKSAKKGPRTAEGDVVTAHRPLYGKGLNDKPVKGPRRSFLPYRQELLGLFAPVNAFAHNSNKRNSYY
ncbi:uncharacterized protein LOC121987816 [Zingiber officinale]|uniref:Uncharacterized protein n=1 Tax=Zingiber officinale TaxID=94328 RepID=A0A8J5GD68_ZINOF|nr:uncharacterized protein LOC121987816 [Zingiber officinale]KAG6505041.1 hypothetical protein ZIOFF_037389 [Zingiber officinale]